MDQLEHIDTRLAAIEAFELDSSEAAARLAEEQSIHAAFIDAADRGDLDMIEAFIEWGVDVNRPGASRAPWGAGEWMTALIAASHGGCPAVVDALLRAGAKVDCELPYASYGSRALTAASCCENELVVAMLLDVGAEVNFLPPAHIDNPLRSAIWAGSPAAARQLLERGANVDISLVQLALKGWCSPTSSGRWGRRVRKEPKLTIAKAYKQCVDLLLPHVDMQSLEMLQTETYPWARDGKVAEDAPVDARRLTTLPERAAKFQAKRIVRECKRALHPMPDDLVRRARGLLAHGASRGNLKLARALLPFVGARHCDDLGVTPLMRAAEGAHPEMVALLAPISDANAVDTSRELCEGLWHGGNTALMKASALDGGEQAARCVEILLQYADPAMENCSGKTAIMLAATKGHTPVFQLLEAAANALSGKGYASRHWSALLSAVEHGHADLVERLVNVCEVDARAWDPANYYFSYPRNDFIGETALMVAAGRGDAPCLRALLARGDARLRDGGSKGETALMKAALSGSLECVEMLLPLSDVDAFSGTERAYWSTSDVDWAGSGSALILASLGFGGRREHRECVMSIAKKANIALKNSEGLSAISVARECGQEQIASELEWMQARKEGHEIAKSIGDQPARRAARSL